MLGRVKAGRVQLNQPRQRIPEQAARSGGEIGKPRTNPQDQIRFCSEFIGRAPAGDADRTDSAGMIPGKRALPRLCLGDRYAMPRREIGERFAGYRIIHPTTGNDQRRTGSR